MTGFRKALDDALDAHGAGKGTVEVDAGEAGTASVDVNDAGKLGVRVRKVALDTGKTRDVVEAARQLPDRIRSLGERVGTTEVDPGLGGTILRTIPEDIRQGPGGEREFFEIDVHADGKAGVRRQRVQASGDREPVDWDMTRDQLGRLLDELS